MNSTGLSGDTLVSWGPSMVSLKAYITCSSSMVEGKDLSFEHNVHLINAYSPYKNRSVFWDATVQEGILDDHD